jgi:hypothetical protein
MTPEGKVKMRVKVMLDMFDAYRFMPVQTGFGVPTLDFLVCIRGHFIAIETKAPGKKPTERQETTIEQIKSAGGHVFVVDNDETLALACKAILDLAYNGENEWPPLIGKILLPRTTLYGSRKAS